MKALVQTTRAGVPLGIWWAGTPDEYQPDSYYPQHVPAERTARQIMASITTQDWGAAFDSLAQRMSPFSTFGTVELTGETDPRAFLDMLIRSSARTAARSA